MAPLTRFLASGQSISTIRKQREPGSCLPGSSCVDLLLPIPVFERFYHWIILHIQEYRSRSQPKRLKESSKEVGGSSTLIVTIN